MSDMLEDGASGGAGPLPPNESHDEFLELCATATTGFLTREERRMLDEHLSHCESCREVMAQYQAIVDRVIPALPPSLEKGPASSGWSPDLAESQLFARLNESGIDSVDECASKAASLDPNVSLSSRKPRSSEETLWRHMWIQFAAAVMLVAALGLMAYRIGKRRGVDTSARASSLPVSKPTTSPIGVPDSPGSTQGSSARKEAELRVEALQSQLRESFSEIERLKIRQQETEKQMALNEADRSKLVQDRAVLSQQLETAQRNLEAAQQKLEFATNQTSQANARNTELQQKLDQATDSMHERDQEVARERELLDKDRDIRELMGSRDLYIAEVYDVAKTGDTEKPFGRVFYTKGKSLIFYAYDLDQRSGLKPASIFQAWGRRGPDRDQAVNLGILYEDNTANKRWVLKSANAKTLAEIDAVFVTVEPHGGSAHPSGKPLLFAYLRIQPNHP